MEIGYHNTRLAELSNEAFKVLEMMRKEGMPQEVHDPLFEIAVKAAGLEKTDGKDQDLKEKKDVNGETEAFAERSSLKYI